MAAPLSTTATVPCRYCDGTGETAQSNGRRLACFACHGTGRLQAATAA